MITAHHQIFGRKYTQPIPTDYILAYNFNGNLLDSSGNGRNATANGTITYGVGRKGIAGTAINFGANSYVKTPIVPSSTAFSFSFWLKTTQNNVQNRAIILYDTQPNNAKVFLIGLNYLSNINTQITAGHYTSNVSFENMARTTSQNMYDGTWKHVVVILDTSQVANNEVKIYINGVFATVTKLYNSNTSYSFFSDALRIGGEGLQIDDFKIYNYPLTQTQITNLYNE